MMKMHTNARVTANKRPKPYRVAAVKFDRAVGMRDVNVTISVTIAIPIEIAALSVAPHCTCRTVTTVKVYVSNPNAMPFAAKAREAMKRDIWTPSTVGHEGISINRG
jgi:hypothetical protein